MLDGVSKARSPEFIFGIMTAYQRSAVLKAAIELDVFSAISKGANTSEAIALHCVASERGVRVLMDYLVTIGLLTRSNDRYMLTRDSAIFLDRRSSEYLGNAIEFFMHPTLMEHYSRTAAAIRNGGTTVSSGGIAEPDGMVWVDYARVMGSAMLPIARVLTELVRHEHAGSLRVLDVAAGHGMFGIAIGVRDSSAQVVALDWPAVLQVAQEHALRAGLEERFTTVPGDALEVDLGTGYDIVIVGNFLHQFDVQTCESFLTRVRNALKPGGRVFTVEFTMNEDCVSPPASIIFGMTMLVSTPKGRTYTFRALEQMFRQAGFARSEIQRVPGAPENIIVSYTD